MTTQERLQKYQELIQRAKVDERQFVGQRAELDEQLEAKRSQIAQLSGAIQALNEELQAQNGAE